MPHSIFGWSYPPGCSGPPEDPPEIPCETCKHSEFDHDYDDVADVSGRCLADGCHCTKFVPMQPAPESETVMERFDPLPEAK